MVLDRLQGGIGTDCRFRVVAREGTPDHGAVATDIRCDPGRSTRPHALPGCIKSSSRSVIRFPIILNSSSWMTAAPTPASRFWLSFTGPMRGFITLLLSRNFGHQSALSAGLAHASGEAVIMMDGDLQHPPQLIPTLLDRWRAGFDIVNTVRLETEEITTSKRLFSGWFYRAFNAVSSVRIEPGNADFRLVSKAVADALNELPERHRFLRGLDSLARLSSNAGRVQGTRAMGGAIEIHVQAKHPVRPRRDHRLQFLSRCARPRRLAA